VFKEDDMDKKRGREVPGSSEGARRATGEDPGEATSGPLGPGQRWSVARKREVALRLLRGESLESLSRELGVETYRLESWKRRALDGIDASLRQRKGTPEQAELDAAMKRIGELSMENELLRVRCRQNGPFAPGRSR
jgi:transposase-like protein